MENRGFIHPADLADELQRLAPHEAQARLRSLPKAQAAAVVRELDDELRPALLAGLSIEELGGLLANLPHDQAADLIGELPRGRQKELIGHLPREHQQEVARLLEYPPDTAGGIMSDDFIALQADQTVEDCLTFLQGKAEESPDAISYLYVTDSTGKLVGIVSLRDLVFRKSERRISELMNRDVKFVSVHDDQEKIARLFEHYHYLALPVLEADGRLMGIVSAQQVMGVIQDEATEDMQLMVGLSGEERAFTPWHTSIRKRLPWLCVNLLTAFVAGAVVQIFENTIARWTALAIFLPIVAGQGGNAGAQTLTVIVREMALGEMSKGDGRKALLKETILGVCNGLAIGLLVGVVGYLWKGSVTLGVVVAIAMLLNMIAAAVSGVVVPYGLRACKIDPALASSIFVTTVTDVAGFFFFLGLAALALRILSAH
jgi:magnesium transporter